jgi:hypothetical protein
MPPEIYIRIAKEVDDAYFTLVPDFSAWQTKGLHPGAARASSLDLLREAMPYTSHVHAKAHFFNEEGVEPGTPYDQLVPIISQSDFDGYISAEFEGWWGGMDFDSKKIAETHVNLIRRYL